MLHRSRLILHANKCLPPTGAVLGNKVLIGNLSIENLTDLMKMRKEKIYKETMKATILEYRKLLS